MSLKTENKQIDYLSVITLISTITVVAKIIRPLFIEKVFLIVYYYRE